jgi:hypothetical protein
MVFTFSDLFDLLILAEKDKILKSISSQKIKQKTKLQFVPSPNGLNS